MNSQQTALLLFGLVVITLVGIWALLFPGSIISVWSWYNQRFGFLSKPDASSLTDGSAEFLCRFVGFLMTITAATVFYLTFIDQ